MYKRQEIHNATKPSIDFIFTKLEECYDKGIKYDVTDMRPAILTFAMDSTHQADYCVKLVNKMKFKSDEPSVDQSIYADSDPVFYDCEVFPNLFLVNYKKRGQEIVTRLINPTSEDIEQLLKYKLIGFNCRRYDNHIMYARLMGYDNEQLFKLSQRIISGSPNEMCIRDRYRQICRIRILHNNSVPFPLDLTRLVRHILRNNFAILP